MTPNDTLDRLILSTHEIGRIIRSHMMCGQPAGKMNLGELHGLLVISEHPKMTMGELAEALHVSLPSSTSLVNRLVKNKLVQRRHDLKNRKLVRLMLTEQGKTILAKQHRKRREMLRKIFGLLSSQEQRTLTLLHEELLHRFSSSHSAISPSL